MRLLITGGGTGGHLVIAKALKEEALAQGDTLFYIGSTYGQDQKWFADDNDIEAKHFFETSGVVNKKGLKKLFSLFAIFVATLKARRFIKSHKIDAVISVGGYAAAPASFAAILSSIPYYIHEQNAYIGTLNKLLRRYTKTFFSSYHTPHYDYPVRTLFFDKARERSRLKTLLFLGGSQGAKAINELALSLAPFLQKHEIRIIHQCGDAHFEQIKQAYQHLDIKVTLFAFSDQIAELMHEADFAIARAGASTVWEITANQLPTLFIPYPYAAGDHQAANAQAHVDQDAAWMMRESEIDIEAIERILLSDLSDVSRQLATMLKPHAARTIISTIKKDLHA